MITGLKLNKPADESLKITTKRPQGRPGKYLIIRKELKTMYNEFIAAINGKCTENVLHVYTNNKFFAKYPASTAKLVVNDLNSHNRNAVAIDSETGEIIYN